MPRPLEEAAVGDLFVSSQKPTDFNEWMLLESEDDETKPFPPARGRIRVTRGNALAYAVYDAFLRNVNESSFYRSDPLERVCDWSCVRWPRRPRGAGGGGRRAWEALPRTLRTSGSGCSATTAPHPA